MKSNPRAPQLEKARMQQQRPNAAKNKEIKNKLKNNNKLMKWFSTQSKKFFLIVKL